MRSCGKYIKLCINWPKKNNFFFIKKQNQSLELVKEITRLQDRIFTDSQKFSTKLDDQKIVEILNNPIYNEKTLAILNKEVERCSQEKRDRFIQMSKEINDNWMNLIKDENGKWFIH